MGAGQSTSEEEALNGSSKGFHIVKVAPNSPGEAAGLEPYFDFILFVNGHRLDDPEDNTLQEVVRSTVGAGAAEVSLVVYSSKHQGIRGEERLDSFGRGSRLQVLS